MARDRSSRMTGPIRRFRRSEDGMLLVFFMVCTVAILGIVALSFDMGRRAATQTDMQAYVDNVALAAAGELDRTPNAIDNATRAANTVIDAANEQIKAGTAGQTATLTIDRIVFYENLPDRDGPSSFNVAELRDPASANYKYGLPPSDLGTPPDATRANYVGVLLDAVDVDWMFANIFNARNLPDTNVRATAIAGLSPWSCDVSPLMFCLPNQGAAPAQLSRGQFARLKTARQGQTWRPADFGFLRIGLDPAGPCAAIGNVAGQQACLITYSQRIAECFQNERANVVTGQRPLQETSIFNMGFDLFTQSMIQFASDPAYAQGPHSINGRNPAGSGDVCTQSQASDTMPFPPDDCWPGGCPDFGSGDWTEGRENYVRTNYTIWNAPFEPGDTPGNAARSAVVPGSFFDFPENRLTRHEYYLREIERAANGGVMTRAPSPPYNRPQYRTDNDGGRGSTTPEPVTAYTTWDDYWPDSFTGLNPIIPDAHGREDNGLPICNATVPSGNLPDRRVILAAGIHCPDSGSVVTGNATDIAIEDYYRLFLLEPVTGGAGLPPYFEMSVEVVDRLPVSTYTAHEVVQLYR